MSVVEQDSVRGSGPEESDVLLTVKGIKVHFPIKRGVIFDKTIGYVYAVDGVDLQIRRGETYQTNLTLPLTAGWHDGADDPGRYERLLGAQGHAFGAYLDLGRHHVLSVSPELFFARRGSTVTTRPMKGTARRGPSSASTPRASCSPARGSMRCSTRAPSRSSTSSPATGPRRRASKSVPTPMA